MTFKPLYFVLLVLLLSWSCGYTNPPAPSEEWPDVRANAPLSLAAECATEGETIPQGVVFGGVVTANDRSGNFYQSILFEDQSAAVELHIGLYDLHNSYPVGTQLAVRADGLAVMSVNGVVQMGRTIASWSDYRVEPLGVPAVVDRCVVVVGRGEPVEPQRVLVDTLSERMCGRLVRVEGLRYVGDESDWGTNPYSSTSYRLFLTSAGDSLAVCTSRYADFATRPLPVGEVNISGILYHDRQFGADMFVLKPRTYEDIDNR